MKMTLHGLVIMSLLVFTFQCVFRYAQTQVLQLIFQLPIIDIRMP